MHASQLTCMHASRRMGTPRPPSPPDQVRGRLFETPAAKTLPAPQGEGGRNFSRCSSHLSTKVGVRTREIVVTDARSHLSLSCFAIVAALLLAKVDAAAATDFYKDK